SSCTAGSISSPGAAPRTSCATTSTRGRRPRRSRATRRSSAPTSSRCGSRAPPRSRPSWSSCAAARWCGGCRRSTRDARRPSWWTPASRSAGASPRARSTPSRAAPRRPPPASASAAATCGAAGGSLPRSLVQLRVVRLVPPHLDARVDVDAAVVERALEEERDVALEAAALRIAPGGGQEVRVERLLGGGARPLVGLGGEAPRLDVLARLIGVVERELHLAGGERHAGVGHLAVVMIAVEELRVEVEGGEQRRVRLQDLARDHELAVGVPVAQALARLVGRRRRTEVADDAGEEDPVP